MARIKLTDLPKPEEPEVTGFVLTTSFAGARLTPQQLSSPVSLRGGDVSLRRLSNFSPVAAFDNPKGLGL